MADLAATEILENRWDDAHAATLDEPGRLLYRSHLLGADKRITNYGGGNTSAKVMQRDPLTGKDVEVLWVKGSGGDVGTIKLDGFATLYMEKLQHLKSLYRGEAHEDEMVGYLPHCTFDLNPRAASIDTPLHAFIPYRHVDHMHPDAVIAIAAMKNSRTVTQKVFGDEIGWLPWRRPGFQLGLDLERFVKEHPKAKGAVLGGHGLITWGDSAKECYEVNSRDLSRLAAMGTSCPDHFLRTKIAPLVVPFDPVSKNLDTTVSGLDKAIADYRADYAAYYERCKRPDSPKMRDPNAVVYLVPGVGMITFARDKATARIAGEFYVNAINVMRGAALVDSYVGLPEREAFDIEYWLLEEAKLQRMPKPKSLAGRIALVTGGAGGIGRAIAAKLMGEGACVVLADIDQQTLAETEASFAKSFSKDQVRSVLMDVTDENAVAAAYAHAATEYGGLDILVSNAGISSASPIDETELAVWDRNMDILGKGYFLVSREAFRLMKKQKLGGAIVFIASKNGLAASVNASAYCTAKAAEIHLARCLALEGAEHGIRVNTVNPDAVLRGSKIWTGEWRAQRAAAYNMKPDELEEHYRKRSMLKLSVYPEDIAEAVYFLASDLAAKSTGNIINVDAGNAQSFTR
jgi:rhamnose utilization protein RhaD (predicted bifunctional aldolase and dehydrogenase)/NAD(P)-dependent dehydrogenase (short-subunit alcohol dehydrogenase family)